MLMPQLESQGLIRREGDPKDKRVLRLYLTPQGEELLLKALKAYMALIDKVMANSTPAQCDAMGDQMRKIHEMLKDE